MTNPQKTLVFKRDEQRIFKAFRRVLANAVVTEELRATVPARQDCILCTNLSNWLRVSIAIIAVKNTAPITSFMKQTHCISSSEWSQSISAKLIHASWALSAPPKHLLCYANPTHIITVLKQEKPIWSFKTQGSVPQEGEVLRK